MYPDGRDNRADRRDPQAADRRSFLRYFERQRENAKRRSRLQLSRKLCQPNLSLSLPSLDQHCYFEQAHGA